MVNVLELMPKHKKAKRQSDNMKQINIDKSFKRSRIKDWSKINAKERLYLNREEKFFKANPALAVGHRWSVFRHRWDRYQFFNGAKELRLYCNRLYIKFTMNNIFVSLTNNHSKVLYTLSSGVLGFRGKKKTSINAVYNITRAVSYKCLSLKITKLVLYFDYVLRLRHYLLRPLLKGLLCNNVEVGGIIAYTGLSHNGLRKRKQRRK
jgi:ribosomal protein S11